MSERTAKLARRLAGPAQPKRLFKPLLVPIKNEKGEPIDTYIPRKQRRKIMRMFMADYRKGRLSQPQEQN